MRQRGHACDCGAFIMRVSLRDEGETARSPRLGVIASRRVGNAVCRNRAKRRLRELFRLNQDKLPAHADVLLIARGSCVHMSAQSLKMRYFNALQRCLKAL